MNDAGVKELLQHPGIWRGGRSPWTGPGCLSTGFAELDACLPGGGWPQGTLTEVLLPRHGIGELQLILPALLHLNQGRKWIALIEPPHIPYAPAWQAGGLDISRLLWIHSPGPADHLWALEQALQSGTCGAVIAWPQATPGFQQLRRLQLAAQTGQCWGVLFQVSSRAEQATPAAVRLQLNPRADGLDVRLLKRRGAWAGETVQLALPFSPR